MTRRVCGQTISRAGGGLKWTLFSPSSLVIRSGRFRFEVSRRITIQEKERKKEEVVEEEEEEERTKGNRGGIGDRTWQVFQGLRFGRKI